MRRRFKTCWYNKSILFIEIDDLYLNEYAEYMLIDGKREGSLLTTENVLIAFKHGDFEEIFNPEERVVLTNEDFYL